MAKCRTVILCIFALYFTVSELTVSMFEYENTGQGHGVQLSQWCPSMGNNNIDNSRPVQFLLALTVSEILKFRLFNREQVGQVHGV